MDPAVSKHGKVSGVDEPIHLLRPTGDHRSLVADPAALRQLEALGPVSVLSVIGNQRGGKSTLMNLLHSRKLQGFQMGHYMDPQTHGLWMWSRPHPRRDGLTVLLVDSEGLDSPHVPQHYNWLVSAVTLLISDVFMYQTKGSIEQSSADRLDMILKVASHLGKSGNGDKATRPESTFLWLLRDHQLQMKRSPKEELKEKLDSEQIRSLSKNFSDYDCVPLPRPAMDDVLKNLDQHSFQDLSSDFREEFVVFERRLMELLTCRQLFGRDLTGAGLAEMLKQYLTTLGQQGTMLGDICQMPTQRELLRQLASRRAVDAGVQKYEETLVKAGLRGRAQQLPVKPSALLAGHESARSAALEAFNIEGRASLLDEDGAADGRALLEAKLACWDNRVQFAGVRLGENEDPGESVAAEVFVAGAHSPLLSKAPVLSGGLLRELWDENLRRAAPAYQTWLQDFSSVRDRVFEGRCVVKEDEAPRLVNDVKDLYAKLHNAVAEAEQNSALGPFGPVKDDEACSGLPSSAAQQADELIAMLVEGALDQILCGLNRRFEDMKQQLELRVQSVQEETAHLIQEQMEQTRQSCAEQQAAQEKLSGLVTKALREAKATSVKQGADLQATMSEAQTRNDVAFKELRELLDQQQRESVEADEACNARINELEQLLKTTDRQQRDRLTELSVANTSAEQRLTDLETGKVEADEKYESKLSQMKGLIQASDRQQGNVNGGVQSRLGALEDKVQKQDAASKESVQLLATKFETSLTNHINDLAQQLESYRSKADCGVEQVDAALNNFSEKMQTTVGQLNEDIRQAAATAQHASNHAEQVAESNRLQVEARCRELVQPLTTEIAALRQDAAHATLERRRAAEFMERNDFNTIWESFAHLASRLTDIQCAVDDVTARLGGT